MFSLPFYIAQTEMCQFAQKLPFIAEQFLCFFRQYDKGIFRKNVMEKVLWYTKTSHGHYFKMSCYGWARLFFTLSQTSWSYAPLMLVHNPP